MGVTITPTRFPEVNDLLTEFVSVVRSILSANLVGIYLTGSFALGAADAASDCDFLVVTADRVGRDEERALRRLHDEIPTGPGYWAQNLEGSYAPRPDLETRPTLGRPWLYVDRGARELEWSAHCNTEVARWVLRERPFILAGADPREFACEIPAAVLQRKMPPQIESFLDELLTWASFDSSWTQRYAVEQSSRMLYTLEHGRVVSKPQALDWATGELPAEWRDLIDQVRADRYVQWNDPPRPGSVERTLAFIEVVQERARARSKRPVA
jgi:predicted nucleotidyltransferase